MKTKIYYVMDTMCGWCYGFSDVINRIHEKYKSHLDFTILPGGMWIGEDVKTMNSSLAHYIKTHNVTVTRLTGQEFGSEFEKNILQNNEFLLDSFPGAKAVTVMQGLNKEEVLPYLKEVQKAFYIQGKDTNDWQLYATIAHNFGISKGTFKNEYFSEEQSKATVESFVLAQQLGVSTYPSVVAVVEGKARVISQGHMQFDELDAVIGRYI